MKKLVWFLLCIGLLLALAAPALAATACRGGPSIAGFDLGGDTVAPTIAAVYRPSGGADCLFAGNGCAIIERPNGDTFFDKGAARPKSKGSSLLIASVYAENGQGRHWFIKG